MKNDKKINFLNIIKIKTVKENNLHAAQLAMVMPHKV